jgi:excisionase family DNA binding protein
MQIPVQDRPVQDRLLTLEEVASRLDCSVRTVRRMIKQGKFTPCRLLEGRVRGLLRIPESQLAALSVVVSYLPPLPPPPPPLAIRRRTRVKPKHIAYF